MKIILSLSIKHYIRLYYLAFKGCLLLYFILHFILRSPQTHTMNDNCQWVHQTQKNNPKLKNGKGRKHAYPLIQSSSSLTFYTYLQRRTPHTKINFTFLATTIVRYIFLPMVTFGTVSQIATGKATLKSA